MFFVLQTLRTIDKNTDKLHYTCTLIQSPTDESLVKDGSEELWCHFDGSGDRESGQDEVPDVQRKSQLEWRTVAHQVFRAEHHDDVEERGLKELGLYFVAISENGGFEGSLKQTHRNFGSEHIFGQDFKNLAFLSFSTRMVSNFSFSTDFFKKMFDDSVIFCCV